MRICYCSPSESPNHEILSSRKNPKYILILYFEVELIETALDSVSVNQGASFKPNSGFFNIYGTSKSPPPPYYLLYIINKYVHRTV
jgi:hypothetical protein